MSVISNVVAVLALVALSSTRSDASDCPALYRRYSQEHTFCQPASKSCNILAKGVDNQQIQEIVEAHNKHRSKLATGQETANSLPSAADMLEMTWDSELATIAQKLVEQCIGDEDCDECRQTQSYDSVGQSLFAGWSSRLESYSIDWSRAVESWYSEVFDFQPEYVSSFPESHRPTIVHFAQVIWAKSFAVGCGFAAFSDDGGTTEMYVCNYGPAGSWEGDAVYVEGKSCSQCPNNTCCTDSCGDKSSYPGLCKIETGKYPEYPTRPGDYLYQCNFSDFCDLNVLAGESPWHIYSSRQESYMGIVLKGGESTTILSKMFKGIPTACFTFRYRNGPNVAGEKSNSTVEVVINEITQNYYFHHHLDRTYDQRFLTKSIQMNSHSEIQYSFVFSVPEGDPEQYLEVADVYVRSGEC